MPHQLPQGSIRRGHRAGGVTEEERGQAEGLRATVRRTAGTVFGMMALGAQIPMLVLARSRQHLPAPKLIQFSALSAGGCHLQQPCFAPWQAKNTTMTGDRVVHVIDDDAAIRRALVRLLRSAGLHVLTYETAAAVLDAASDLSSGCMLLDLQMPGMDGIELLARLGKLGVCLTGLLRTRGC